LFTVTAEHAIDIVTPSTPKEFAQVRELLVEFMEWDAERVADLGLDADLMKEFYYDQGVLDLPGAYAPPAGYLLLAVANGLGAGCGAFSASGDGVCELKRVYVRDAYRGRKLGHRLVQTLMAEAREVGYRRMRLETVTFMKSAIAMYEELGFRECSAYYDIPVAFREVTMFMERAL
jgi:GNAT superfamily N-acetyltransferase